jgi:DNA replication protein DnaC
VKILSFDEKILNRVIDSFNRKRLRSELDSARRREEICKRVPRIAEIDEELKTASIKIISSSLRSGTNPVPGLGSLKDYNRKLREEKAALLKKAGLPADWLEVRYDCPICNDSGFIPSGPCNCLVEAYAAEQTKELGRLLPIESKTFESFSFDYYSDKPDPKWGMSPRDNMTAVFDTCREFAVYFGPQTQNLLLCGGTGLGKTFLASCIAGVLSRKGISVIYDTAVNIFSVFEKERFGRDPETSEEASSEVNRFLNTDLLILDDLGTEMHSPFINTALYTLINSRLVKGKKMVIITVLTEDVELPRRYSPQIVSRLKGEFLILPFFGEDIRIKKNLW